MYACIFLRAVKHRLGCPSMHWLLLPSPCRHCCNASLVSLLPLCRTCPAKLVSSRWPDSRPAVMTLPCGMQAVFLHRCSTSWDGPFSCSERRSAFMILLCGRPAALQHLSLAASPAATQALLPCRPGTSSCAECLPMSLTLLCALPAALWPRQQSHRHCCNSS